MHSRIFGSLLLSILLALPRSSPADEARSAAEAAKMGQQALQQGRGIEAKGALQEAVRLAPKRAAYHAALAETEWSLGEFQEAIHHFEIALKLSPADADSRSRLAQGYWSQHRDLDVLRILAVPEPQEPLRSMWRFSRGLSLFRLSRLAEARRQLRTLVDHPDFAAPANFFMGRIAYAQNHFEEAAPFFAKAVRLGDSPPNKGQNSYAYDYGLTLFRLGRYSEANVQFMAATDRYPQDPSPWMMRGRCEEELGNHRAAIDNYEKSIRLGPKLEVTYYHLARLHERYGDKQRAAELFKQLGDLKERDLLAQEENALKLRTEAEAGQAKETPVQ